MKNAITRFAPSPTGQVHIGNIRTAIFNWLYAHHTDGKFLLRIEDTDRERSTPEAIQTLFETMQWLGLEYDEEPLYQSQRQAAHLEAAQMLLSKGFAYEDDFGKPELGKAIVFRMPGNDITFSDEVKGTLTKKAKDMKDLVIIRGNGTPVFHLANVLDDIFMGVNIVIRGDDHVENTFRHIALYRALEADTPQFAHLPMIVNAQKKPYSKRDGDAFVGDFRQNGFFPEALFNYLALLGWSPGDDREVMTRKEMIDAFDFPAVQSSPAQMDIKKLTWMNGEYLKKLPVEELKQQCLRALKKKNLAPSSADYFDRALILMRDRLKFPHEIATAALFLFSDDFPCHEKTFRKRMQKEGIVEMLQCLKKHLSDTKAPHQALANAAQELTLEPTKLYPPLRIAISGQGGGPDLIKILTLLNRQTILHRLEQTLGKLAQT